MTARLLHALATTDALAAVFSDAALLEHMLRFEVALARAQAAEGLAPPRAADAIGAVPLTVFDTDAIARSARASGTVAIGFVEALTAYVRTHAAEAAPLVHRGATSQDVTDTALVLALQRAAVLLAADHRRLIGALRRLSDRHRDTVMLARTLLQPAAPTSFGLKVAGWFAGIARANRRLTSAFADARALQFGGPVGTLAALGPQGPAVAERMAAELGLTWPGAAWHTERDRFAGVAGACAMYVAALGKMARDISLLMQFEVGEAAEPGGGSSSMTHKRNPAASALILAAANRVAALTSGFLAGMAQEHERGIGGWHAEALTLAEVVQATGSALAAAADAIEHLRVDPERMRHNLEATRGTVFASDAGAAREPEAYLGSAETFRTRLLSEDDGTEHG